MIVNRLLRLQPLPFLLSGLLVMGTGLGIYGYGRDYSANARKPLLARSAETLRAVTRIWFSPGGQLMATEETTNGGVHVLSFSEANGQLVATRSQMVAPPISRVWAVSPDGGEIANGEVMRTGSLLTMVSDVWKGTIIDRFDGAAEMIAYTGESVLVSLDARKVCRIIDRGKGTHPIRVIPLSLQNVAGYKLVAGADRVAFTPPTPSQQTVLVDGIAGSSARATFFGSRVEAFGPGSLMAVLDEHGQLVVGRLGGLKFVARDHFAGPDVRAMVFYDDVLLVATPRQIVAVPGLPSTLPPESFADTANVRLLAAAPPRWAYLTNEGVLTVAQRNLLAERQARQWLWIVMGVSEAGALLLSLGWTAWLWQRRQSSPDYEPSPRFDTLESSVGSDVVSVPQIPPDLITAITERRTVLIAGHRIAVAAQMPDMQQLLGMFIDEAQKLSELTREDADVLREALARGRTDLVADELSGKVRSGILSRIGSRFLDRSNVTGALRSTPVHKALESLPFAAVINTAINSGLRTSMVHDTQPIRFGDSEALIEAMGSTGRLPFIELFGDSKSGYVFGPNTLRRAMFESRRFRSALQSLLSGHALVFIGLSTAEVRSFSEVMDLRSVSNSHRFVIAEVGRSDVEANLLRHEPQTTLVEVDPSQGARLLTTIVTRLAESVQKGNPSPIGRTGNADVRVQRVVLQNIGPFPSLELDLERDWNLFLGNNGRGKSIVLRAIAAGLCGEKLDPVTARRLLRSGAVEGSIEITVGSEPYLLKFDRERLSGEVTVRGGLSPVEIGRLLAIGFPPVRTVSWKRLSGPSSERSASVPQISDIAPLASSAADPRLDDLKQWLINLDYRARGKKEDAKAARTLFNHFFTVLDAITPDVDLAFDSIDTKTFEIRVKTTGGTVALESLSQGTTSVIGWVGVLLQRMYEVFGGEERPEEQTALVLVDEVDANMHPSWQQTIVRALTDLFKNVQFVVTTHSPLIVTSLDKRQVFMFKRRGDGVLVEKPDFDVRGLRPDQLLTTPLFDLETVRDPIVHERLMKYTALAARDDLGDKERQELQEHAEFLGMNLPSPHARAEARQAFELIESSLNDKIEQMPDEVKLRVLNEVKVQLQEISSESRRPE